MTTVGRRATHVEICLVALAAVVPLLPFVTKAVSVDAPVFIAVAKQILADPLDPYGFQMIWDPTSPNAWEFNRNPPLLSYWLAGWIAVFGEVDTWLHVAMLPFSLLAALAFLGIASRLTDAGARAPLLLIATPAYLVLATTLMLDVAVLGFMLLAVHALLRGAERDAANWQLLAGFAGALAGLTKYIGFSIAPLLAAGVLLLYPRRVVPLLRVLSPPLLVWGAWAAFTAATYGEVHFAGSTDVVFDSGRLHPDEFWNHVASTPVYFGCALIFPIFIWARALFRGDGTTLLAVVGAMLGAVAVTWVLPAGEPSRREALGADEAVYAALGLAGAVVLVGACFRPSRLRAGPSEQFLLLWLAGLLVFSMFLNWHVNVADALLAAPPLALLVFRNPDLRPSPRAFAVWLACLLPLSLALAWADRLQVDTYRDAAQRIAVEIGPQPGARYFVGNWGLQHYLERQGFQSVVPPHYGHTDFEVGDWVASARNISQLDVTQNMREARIRPVWVWDYDTSFPLRTSNADAAAGFYSHHGGYTPFAWSDKPLEKIGIGRVTAVRAPARRDR